jgi:spermidine/putrescine-binding protein
MKFFVPKEGAAAWIDQFCIVADGPNKEAAYLWIDHMLSPEIASQMIQKMGYMVVNAKVVSALPPEMAKLMTYTDEETKRLVPYPTLKSETQEKMTKAYHDVRGQ